MQDSFFSTLMFHIERMICLADREAKEKGIILKDSQMQSTLIKTKALLRRASPKIAKETELDEVLQKLMATLCQAPNDMREQIDTPEGAVEETPLRISDWTLALEEVIKSLKVRRSGIPGSRDYLDFVQDFIEQASAKSN
ncbi:hypothetical protein BH11VER1_BH11VER1_06180 [soil metagenome]